MCIIYNVRVYWLVSASKIMLPMGFQLLFMRGTAILFPPRVRVCVCVCVWSRSAAEGGLCLCWDCGVPLTDVPQGAAPHPLQVWLQAAFLLQPPPGVWPWHQQHPGRGHPRSALEGRWKHARLRLTHSCREWQATLIATSYFRP